MTRILMVTPYPPARDGLASYAVQEVKQLRAEGHDVEVLSPSPSAAHHHLDLQGPRGPLALAKRLRDYDRVIVQYHPAVFGSDAATDAQRAATAGSLLGALRYAGNVELRVHEFDVELDRRSKAEQLLARGMWRAARRIVVHTEAERAELAALADLAPDRIEVGEHGAHFVRRTTFSTAEARARLGIPTDAFVFLSIGFIQPHKGFDRAVRAFAGLGEQGCRLEVVGSVRLEDPSVVEYVDDLRALVDATPGVTFHEGYVSDELFDVWIVACDALVLPYRLIWSSGVCERAALYARPVVATRVGGLEDQVSPSARLVDDDRELAAVMRELAARDVPTTPARPWPTGADADQAAVTAVVRERAAARRHGAVTPDAPARSAALRRLAPLTLPAPLSARPGASLAKKLVRRLTAWEIDPLVRQVNRLQQAVVDALEETSRAGSSRGTGPPGDATER